MKKIYLKPEITAVPLFLSACIMSGVTDNEQQTNPSAPGPPAPPAPRRRPF